MAFQRAHELYVECRYREAYEAFVQAASECRTTSSKHCDLLDEISMRSVITGDPVGWGGQLLQVRPADPEAAAWTGLASPGSPNLVPLRGFASIAEALEAAGDGDVLQLLPGTHICSQATLHITKRLIVEGLGSSPAQVVLDHRANHPVFHITRSCILRGFHIDMVGFCEAVAISGNSTTVKPFLQHVTVSCSGGDGLIVSGSAQPLLQHCSIQARSCGLKQFASSTTTLWHSELSSCQNGLLVAGSSKAFLEHCTVERCSEDGVIGLQQAQVSLYRTCVRGCGGPGLDLGDSASAWLKQADIRNCCGGVWLWQSASCEALSSHIAGGTSYAVLLDAKAYTRGSSTSIDGPCHIATPESPGTPDQPRPNKKSSDSRVSGVAPEPTPPAAALAPPIAPTSPFAATKPTPGSERPRGLCSGDGCGCASSGNGVCEEPLVDATMCVADAVAAVSLFPAERGAFAC